MINFQKIAEMYLESINFYSSLDFGNEGTIWFAGEEI